MVLNQGGGDGDDFAPPPRDHLVPPHPMVGAQLSTWL